MVGEERITPVGMLPTARHSNQSALDPAGYRRQRPKRSPMVPIRRSSRRHALPYSAALIFRPELILAHTPDHCHDVSLGAFVGKLSSCNAKGPQPCGSDILRENWTMDVMRPTSEVLGGIRDSIEEAETTFSNFHTAYDKKRQKISGLSRRTTGDSRLFPRSGVFRAEVAP